MSAIDVVLFLLVAGLAYALWSSGRRVSALQAEIYQLSATLGRVESTLDDALATPILTQAAEHSAVVAEWQAEMLKHPEGSPKHTAYLNRLREIGAL